MPIYEYECTKCGKIEEIVQKFSDKPLVKCLMLLASGQSSQIRI